MKATFADAKQACVELVNKGYEAYLVGGCVRDRILGIEPNDYDIVTSANPDQVEAVFPKTIPIGKSFGVVKAVFDTRELDIATYRSDGEYTDSRHPDNVTFGVTAEEDVKRRDFTINALLYDPIQNKVIDYVGGQKDLEDRVLRAIGDPIARFKEDPLRGIRAARFAAKYNLTVDPSTLLGIQAIASTIWTISGERIKEELCKILKAPRASRAIILLSLSKLYKYLFDGSTYYYKSNEEILKTILCLEKTPVDLDEDILLAILCKSKVSYCNSGENFLKRLKLSNELSRSTTNLIDLCNQLTRLYGATLVAKKKIASNPSLEKAFLLLQILSGIDDTLGSTYIVFLDETIKELRELREIGLPKQLVNGDVLKEWGYLPSRHFSEIISLCYDEQLAGNMADLEVAKAFVSNTFPNASRTLENGQIHNCELPLIMMGLCTKCNAILSFSVELDAKGNWNYASIKDCKNCSKPIPHSPSITCTNNFCYKRVTKKKFKRMVL